MAGSGSESEKLSASEASQLLDAFRNSHPDKISNDRTKFEDITPSEVWEKLRLQVFELGSAAFIVKEKTIYPLPTIFGGGIDSMIVANLTSTKEPRLFFSYSWGSGMHYSNIGTFDEKHRKIEVLPLTAWFLTAKLVKQSENEVEVTATSVSMKNKFDGKIGTLVKGESESLPKFVLLEGLPKEISDSIKLSEKKATK